MTPSRARAMLMMFFGSQAAMVFDPDWPETMLQLSPGSQREEVFAALRQRLSTLASHPYGTGDDVDELRIVLKGIAAQMVEGPGSPWTDALEEELGAIDGVLPRLTVMPTGKPDEAMPDAASEVDDDFAEHVLHTVAAHPGAAGLQRAMMIASLHGVSPEAVLALLHGQRPTTAGVEVETVPTLSREVMSETRLPAAERAEAPSKAVAGLWVGVSAAMIASLFGAAWVIGRAAQPRARQAVAPAPVPTLTPAPTPTETSKPLPASLASDGPPNSAIFVRDIEAATKDFDATAASMVAMKRDVGVLMRWWPRLEMPARTAALESIVEAAYKCVTPESATAMIEAIVPLALSESTITPTDADVWPMTGAGGVLARLARERELPVAMSAARDAAIAKAFASRRPGTSFAGGVEAVASGLPMRMLAGDLAALGPAEVSARAAQAEDAADKLWLAITRGVAGGLTGDEGERQSQLVALAAVERVLLAGPDLLENPVAFRFVTQLMGKMRYRQGDPSRARVVAWLGDARVSVGDAHAITQTIARRSGASGVDSSMVLAPGATALERESVRTQISTVWGLGGGAIGAGGGADADWLTSARDAIRLAGTTTVDVEHFAAAAHLANLCRAASMRARGEAVPAALLAAPAVPAAPAAAVRDLSVKQIDDGQWAIKYVVESKGSGPKVARLSELLGGQMGPVDASFVAEAALLSPGELRAAGQAAAQRYASDPLMILALLEVFPRAPRSLRNAIFLAGMGECGVVAPESPQWTAHYRRALVERVLTLTAGQSSMQPVDVAAASIADSFAVMAGSGATDPSPEVAGVAALKAATALFGVLDIEAGRLPSGVGGPVPLTEIHRRRASALAVAEGGVQSFAAEQTACVELLALLAYAERPGKGDELRSLIERLREARRAAASCGLQIRLTQETMLRLWAIRLGEEL